MCIRTCMAVPGPSSSPGAQAQNANRRKSRWMSLSRLPTERTRPASPVARNTALAAETEAMSEQTGATAATAARVSARRRSGPTGTILDRYTLSQRGGSGAFGSVWMARDERLQRDVAVKILARELVSDGRFEREARAAA